MLIVIKYLQELINKLNGFKWKITKKKGFAYARKYQKISEESLFISCVIFGCPGCSR